MSRQNRYDLGMANPLPKQIKTPQRWGHVKFLRSYRTPLWINSPKGPYIGDTQGGPRVMELRCDCGHVFTIPVDDFPGRRKLKSCNRPECPHTARPEPPREPKAQAHWTLTVSILEVVSGFATAKKLTPSKAAEILLREGVMSLAEKGEWPEDTK